jgi:hypothetical protein
MRASWWSLHLIALELFSRHAVNTYRAGSCFQDALLIPPCKLDGGFPAADGLENNFQLDISSAVLEVQGSPSLDRLFAGQRLSSGQTVPAHLGISSTAASLPQTVLKTAPERYTERS